MKQICGIITYMKHIFGSYNSGIAPQDDPFHPFTADEWSQQTPTMMRTYLIQNLPDPNGLNWSLLGSYPHPDLKATEQQQ